MKTADSWKAGAFSVPVEGGKTVEVAGWVKGPFALDFRAVEMEDYYDPCFTLTHMPTGMMICSFLAGKTKAMRLADELAGSGDWNFKNPEGSKNMSKVFADFRDRHGDCVTRISPALGPLEE